ncbi:MAG: hypothetical protein KBC46_03475 [Ferrovibrio sp.]|nr:hypothetical protein [Ferrovibrio sp.]
MASDDAFTLLQGYLEQHWNNAGVRLVWPNERDTELPPRPFIYLDIESGEDDLASIGAAEPRDNLWREAGWLAATVLVEQGEGTRQARQIRDQLAEIFRGLSIGPLRCRAMSRSRGEAWESEGWGNLYGLPLIVNWELDVTP